MMPQWFVIPAVIALGLCPLAAQVLAKGQPARATKALTILMVTTAVASVSALAGVALAYLTAIPWVDSVLRHCPPLHMDHGSVPAVWGITSLVIMAVVVVLVGRALRQQVRDRARWRQRRTWSRQHRSADHGAADCVCPARSPRPHRRLNRDAGPADSGRTRGAHRTRAGASRSCPLPLPVAGGAGHSGSTAAPSAPGAAGLCDRAVGRRDDRRGDWRPPAGGPHLAKAALANHEFGHGSALAFASFGVAARIQALTQREQGSPLRRRIWLAGGGVVLFAVLAASSVQLHHVAQVMAHVCKN